MLAGGMLWLIDAFKTRKIFIETVKYGYGIQKLIVDSMYISFSCTDRKVIYNSLILLDEVCKSDV
jgi:hypothetical protein